jgi:N-acetylmuramoyl-L-alanine amidase
MKKILLLIFVGVITVSVGILFRGKSAAPIVSGAPPYTPEGSIFEGIDDIPDIVNWKRPDGPLRVGLQVGHWKSNELPDELKTLRNNTGASGDGKTEWEVNYAIAQKTADYLTEAGIKVDILPATVPPKIGRMFLLPFMQTGMLTVKSPGLR